jgi:acyl phosphate:glycerol-3-phosphate acyltransferase
MGLADNLLIFAIAYLLGSVPFGLVLTKLSGEGDLRSVGSGNIGATNVLRTGRKGLAAATLLLDLLKGFAAVKLGEWLGGDPAWAALGAVIGHCFPAWLRFKGGKGVATLMGVSLGLAWPVGAVYAAVWIVMLAWRRISSLAGLSAAVAAPIVAWATGNLFYTPVLAILAVLVMWLHRANIARLRAGTEPKTNLYTSASVSLVEPIRSPGPDPLLSKWRFWNWSWRAGHLVHHAAGRVSISSLSPIEVLDLSGNCPPPSHTYTHT